MGAKEEATRIWISSLRSVNVIISKSTGALQDITYRGKIEQMKLRLNLNLAHVSLQAQRWAEAEHYSREALDVESTNIKGLFRLILALLEQDKFVECEKVLCLATESYSHDSSFVVLRERLLAAKKNKYSRERRMWSDILTKSPPPTRHGLFCCRRRKT
jgi:hypothetical protein